MSTFTLHSSTLMSISPICTIGMGTYFWIGPNPRRLLLLLTRRWVNDKIERLWASVHYRLMMQTFGRYAVAVCYRSEVRIHGFG